MAFNGMSFNSANARDRKCVVCRTIFKPKSGIHKFCSEECKGRWKYITGKENTENQYKAISGNWRRFLRRLLYKKDRKALKIDDVLWLLKEQDYKCALSGLDLTCQLEKGNRCWTNVSIDRIEAGGEYTMDNIQLVCSGLNSWRSNVSLDEFIWICKKVAEHNSGEDDA